MKKAKRAAAMKPTQPQPKMKMAPKEIPTTPFTWMVIFYVALFIAHSVLFYIANMIFPQYVVLGTHMISPLMALGTSTALFTLITIAAMPIIEMFQKMQKVQLSTIHWIVLYFVLDFVALWGIGRLAEQVGLGLSSWVVVASLALVADIVQGLVITTLMKKMK